MKENQQTDTRFSDEIMNVGVVEIKESNGHKFYLAIGDDFTQVFGKGESAEQAVEDLEEKMCYTPEVTFTEVSNVLN